MVRNTRWNVVLTNFQKISNDFRGLKYVVEVSALFYVLIGYEFHCLCLGFHASSNSDSKEQKTTKKRWKKATSMLFLLFVSVFLCWMLVKEKKRQGNHHIAFSLQRKLFYLKLSKSSFRIFSFSQEKTFQQYQRFMSAVDYSIILIILFTFYWKIYLSFVTTSTTENTCNMLCINTLQLSFFAFHIV